MAGEESQVAADILDQGVLKDQNIPWHDVWRRTAPAILIGLAFAPVVVLSDYLGSIILIVFVYGITISGFDLMFGWANLYVFCPAAFALIGGVTSALLVDTLGLPFLVGFLAAGVTSALAGLLIAGGVVVIGTDFDIVIATLAFGELLVLLLANWEPVGPTGIFSISRPAIGPFELTSQLAQYGFLLVVFVLTIFAVNVFARSRFGTLIVAMGENEDLFRSIGYNPARYKVITILFGTILLGIGGGLFAHVNGIITPGRFDVHQTLFFTVILLVGGLRSVYGPFVGALVIASLPEVVRLFGMGNIRPYVVGGFLVVVVLVMPTGIVGRLGDKDISSRSFREVLKEWRS